MQLCCMKAQIGFLHIEVQTAVIIFPLSWRMPMEILQAEILSISLLIIDEFLPLIRTNPILVFECAAFHLIIYFWHLIKVTYFELILPTILIVEVIVMECSEEKILASILVYSGRKCQPHSLNHF